MAEGLQLEHVAALKAGNKTVATEEAVENELDSIVEELSNGSGSQSTPEFGQ